jgi:hypothetical protein
LINAIARWIDERVMTEHFVAGQSWESKEEKREGILEIKSWLTGTCCDSFFMSTHWFVFIFYQHTTSSNLITLARCP